MSLLTETRRILAVAVFFALVLVAGRAGAQSNDDLARARQLFSQGLTQEAAGDWAGALATFQDVARIKMTPQVRFHIARSKEHLGRLNEALGGYRLAEYEANQLPPKAAQDLLAEVQSAREKLEARIPKLVIVRGKGAATAKIELDGVALGAAQIGSEVSADPGPHVIAAIAAGGERSTQTVELAEGETKRVEVEAPEPAPAPKTTAPGPTPEPPPQPATDAGVRPSRSALPWIIGGVGVASLAASAVFYKLSNDAESELDANCLDRICPDTLEDTQSKGETYATLTGVTLAAGVVGVGVAAVMLLTRGSPAPERARSSWTISVQPRAHAASFDLSGRF